MRRSRDSAHSWRRHRGKLYALAGLAVLPLLTHVSVIALCRFDPPHVDLPAAQSSQSWAKVRDGIREVYLQGSPEAIGAAHSRLLRDRMIADEALLWSEYERYVPWWIARIGIEDWSRLRYRHLDRNLPEERRRELAAEALGFQPDPFAPRMATYDRMVFLYALYDIALPLEHSPLIGCTSLALDPTATANGHTLVARAFDFEAGEMFDRDKAVFLVRQDGRIPFASVAWPGFSGVVTGMNAQGLVVVVHGARAGDPSADGLPVSFALRSVLERAHDADDAVEVLREQRVMVSHIVFVADGAGHFAVVERAPGAPIYVRRSNRSIAVTNHFEGPLADDPKNVRVRETTTSVARRVRADELLAAVAPASATPASVLRMLRDHKCAGDANCRLGDRRAIDALLATHGIVADATSRVLWVSAGPALSGKFVPFDLRAMLTPDGVPAMDPEPQTLPDDPVVNRDEGRP